jgi:hypothetical protein
MFDKVLQWPSPITTDNWKLIDASQLYDPAAVGINPQLQSFTNILSSIRKGLEAVSDPKVFEDWNFNGTYDDLVAIWIEFLNQLRTTAQSQPGWLQSGQYSFNGNQVSFWNVTYDPSNGSFVITNDPHLLGDAGRQRDFGLLYELGRDLQKMSSLIKGGKNSIHTKASIRSIDDKTQSTLKEIDTKFDETRNQINSELETATADKVAKIKTVEASKDWSQHYESRCEELEGLIKGEKKIKNQKGKKDKKGKMGLQTQRSLWYVALVSTFMLYAVVALLIIHGWKIFKISSDLDQVLNGFGKYFIGLTLYGILAGIYIGYAFSVKQLKVHQNLLEQYRHREIVAKTIEGIVLAVIKTKEGTIESGQESVLRDQDLEQLVKVAATSMFEYRPIGHLSTKEGTSILGDLLNTKNS